MDDKHSKALTSAISNLASRVSDLVDRLRKQPAQVNNVYVTVDADDIIARTQALFDQYVEQMKVNNVTFEQTIVSPPQMSPGDIYRSTKDVLFRAEAGLPVGQGKITTAQAVHDLTEAIRFTVEYVGNDVLPAKEGWSWFDALTKYAPGKAQHFFDNPIHFHQPDPLVIHMAYFGLTPNDVYPACWDGPAQEILMTISTDKGRINCPDCLHKDIPQSPPTGSM
jgi:hypothetical protein